MYCYVQVNFNLLNAHTHEIARASERESERERRRRRRRRRENRGKCGHKTISGQQEHLQLRARPCLERHFGKKVRDSLLQQLRGLIERILYDIIFGKFVTPSCSSCEA